MRSIIIPVDLGRRPKSIQRRVERLAAATMGGDLELVVAIAKRGALLETRFVQLLSKYEHVRTVLVPMTDPVPNSAMLRNYGVDAAAGEVLLFLDADIEPDLELFESLFHDIENGGKLSIAPCLYLSREGTKVLSSGYTKKEIIKTALEFSPKYVLHWAIPSSILAMLRSDYHAIGGFHEGYKGHGYEDFDFMVRLAVHNNLIANSISNLTDITYRSPMLSTGFRSELGALSIPNLLDGKIAVHRFHSKDKADLYYKKRRQNKDLYQRRVSDMLDIDLRTDKLRKTPRIVKVFFKECNKRGIDPQDYYALFDARPRFMLLKNNIFTRFRKKLHAALPQIPKCHNDKETGT